MDTFWTPSSSPDLGAINPPRELNDPLKRYYWVAARPRPGLHAMDTSVTAHESPWPPLGNWDWWPLARLLTVCFVFGAAGHGYLGWHVDLANIVTLPRRIFEVLSFFTLISFGLAHLYLILLMFPLYAAVTLNEHFYGATWWLLQRICRIQSTRLLAVVALSGEILLFGATAILVRHFASRF